MAEEGFAPPGGALLAAERRFAGPCCQPRALRPAPAAAWRGGPLPTRGTETLPASCRAAARRGGLPLPSLVFSRRFWELWEFKISRWELWARGRCQLPAWGQPAPARSVGHGAGDEAATRSLLLAPRPRSVPRFPPEHTAGQRPQGDAGGTDCTHGTRECAKSGVAPPAAAAQHHSGPRGTQDLAFSFASCKLSKPWGVPCGLHKRPRGVIRYKRAGTFYSLQLMR